MSRVPALLVMHADLAAALLRAAETLYGPVDDVGMLSNEGLSRADLERAIEARVAAWPAGGLVLTDMWGGSCYQCGASVARGHGEVVVVAGLNLPTLLDYLHNRDHTTVSELADRLLRKGQDSIRVQRGLPA
jgi:mannose/fructose-specific phosphotransferase system component IIA